MSYDWLRSPPWCSKCYNTYTGNLNLCNGCMGLPDSDIPPTKFVKIPYLVKKEEKKMIITVIGSITKSKDEMIACKKFFERFGHEVHTPIDEGVQILPLVEIQETWIDRIEASDLVVAIPKVRQLGRHGSGRQDVTFGESTSYEMAIAKKFKKQVVVW